MKHHPSYIPYALKQILFFTALIIGRQALAQDTVYMDLPQVEKNFLQHNLLLLANRFQVQAAEAQVIQARLWENPTVYVDMNAVDPENGKVLHVGKSGQKAISFEQLIYLGGKKKNEVALAQTNAQLAQLELEDLLRNLKFTLRVAFYTCYFDLRAVEKYDRQLSQLQAIISAYKEQVAKGNVSLKELVRLEATHLQLYNDRSDLMKSINEQQQTMQVLSGTASIIYPNAAVQPNNRPFSNPLLDSLTAIAVRQRADHKLAETQFQYTNINTRYQKSLAVPDLRLGTAWDQRSGAFNNQVNITAGIALPLWNRNQGNIRSAEKQSAAAELQIRQTQLTITSEVQLAYRNLLLAEKDFQRTNTDFQKQFDELNEGVFLNFQKRNITLLEFTDFIESYNLMITEYNRIHKNLITAYETINYVVSKDIF